MDVSRMWKLLAIGVCSLGLCACIGIQPEPHDLGPSSLETGPKDPKDPKGSANPSPPTPPPTPPTPPPAPRTPPTTPAPRTPPTTPAPPGGSCVLQSQCQSDSDCPASAPYCSTPLKVQFGQQSHDIRICFACKGELIWEGGPTSCKPRDLWTKYGQGNCQARSLKLGLHMGCEACGGGNHRYSVNLCVPQSCPVSP